MPINSRSRYLFTRLEACNPFYFCRNTLTGMWIEGTSRASAIRHTTTAVRRLYIDLHIVIALMKNLLLGFIQALIADEAVLRRFQSSLKKNYVIGNYRDCEWYLIKWQATNISWFQFKLSEESVSLINMYACIYTHISSKYIYLVKSNFLVIGALGGAAKLNQTVLNSITQDDVFPLSSVKNIWKYILMTT